ncbi:CDP-diacylglycerol--glycerol-3-phosphate 3-phosphatidyltransferase [Lysobacter solisilvae (ex Woo and Kim 2020)]|uniref:CDP-diacylglycerol--glycerol-3-phosphate 3-phosphatidyltransferase n=1 Tax=Agrilutibacter terrestris TaxID=2865112 RepID=A0A7H0FY12_9GAMM|nr:CDP-diacylglycerol--glycerol-3-phosphate 3-phosphatidyltransferase [Lysobacter terrestris]QNP40928.1 CDP-diacylglycerol--glycerol-3-phosphate 3-phosphatidyltransferase [Lysobacter terrestris]
MKLTVPTLLTLLRILLIPVLVLVFYLPFKWTNFAAAFVFILASVTDWLDGWIARAYNQSSAFGAFLDPVADKLMVAVALLLIVQKHPTPWMALWAAVIVGREIAVSALREWMAELGQRAKVKVASIGKIKTIVQMVALTILLYFVPDKFGDKPSIPFVIGDWMLAVAALLTLWSGLAYLRAAWPALREDARNS